jgi:hypothetical protein
VTIWPIGRIHAQAPAGHQYVPADSEEWFDRVAFCIEVGKKLGMKVGVQPGTGFPWAGRWVTEKTNLKTLHTHKIAVTGPYSGRIQLPYRMEYETVVLYPRGVTDVKARILDDLIDEEGGLYIEVDAGDWEICIYESVAKGNYPGAHDPEDKNLLVDYLDPAAIRTHLEKLISPILQRIGDDRSTFDYIFYDSWEAGKLHWVQGFIELFHKRRGYDLRPYMPIIERYLEAEEPGYITLGGLEVSEPLRHESFAIGRYRNYQTSDQIEQAFHELQPLSQMTEVESRIMWDFRRTMGELLIDNCYGAATEWCRKHGLVFKAQVHGAPFIDWIDKYGVSDVPQSESYFTNPYGGYEAASAAHTYGKSIVSCESYSYLTGSRYNYFGWTMTNLEDIRHDLDKNFAIGINEVMPIITYSPEGAVNNPMNLNWWGNNNHASGAVLGVSGVCESEMNLYWPYYRPLADYTARISMLMRAGTIAHDVGVYKGDNIKKFVRFLPENDVTQEFEGQWSRYPADRITDHVITHIAKMQDQMLTAGFGQYRAMIFDPGETIRLETLEKIEQCVKEGLTLIATSIPHDVPDFLNHVDKKNSITRMLDTLFPQRKPGVMHTHGKGRTIFVRQDQVVETLTNQGILPHVLSALGDDLRLMHRKMDDADIFFLFNYSQHAFDALEISLRGSGYPELWNADENQMYRLNFDYADGYTKVSVPFRARGSNVVILRKSPSPDARPMFNTHTVDKVIQEIQGPWVVNFKPFFGQTPFQLTFLHLADWTFNRKCFHFAGTGIYEFQFSVAHSVEHAILDLGVVHDLARVTLNGQDLGIVYEAPFRYNMGALHHSKTYAVQIEVVNRTANAFNMRFPSGLLGPVRITSRISS